MTSLVIVEITVMNFCHVCFDALVDTIKNGCFGISFQLLIHADMYNILDASQFAAHSYHL